MKYHSLFFFSKIRKNVENLSSAAVMIGALMVNHGKGRQLDHECCCYAE